MSALTSRIHRLEMKRGGDDTERYLRSLTDEQLEADISKLDATCRQMLAERGVECADTPIHDVLARLQEMEKAEAAKAEIAE